MTIVVCKSSPSPPRSILPAACFFDATARTSWAMPFESRSTLPRIGAGAGGHNGGGGDVIIFQYLSLDVFTLLMTISISISTYIYIQCRTITQNVFWKKIRNDARAVFTLRTSPEPHTYELKSNLHKLICIHVPLCVCVSYNLQIYIYILWTYYIIKYAWHIYIYKNIHT